MVCGIGHDGPSGVVGVGLLVGVGSSGGCFSGGGVGLFGSGLLVGVGVGVEVAITSIGNPVGVTGNVVWALDDNFCLRCTRKMPPTSATVINKRAVPRIILFLENRDEPPDPLGATRAVPWSGGLLSGEGETGSWLFT